ncbi:nitroreductase family protein [Acidaminobacterium chupaoyuni]
MNAIFARKSVRSYTDRPVSREDLRDLLHAGMSAPTAMNDRPWQFILVTDKALLAKLPMDNYTQAVKDAQAAIVVCGDNNKDFNGAGFNIIDCTATVENILVEAADRGLGSVYYAAYPMENRMAHLREVFSLPENIVPYAVLPIGWPEKQPEASDRYDASMVHENRW